ncbi:transposase [Geomonas paludis]|uniref:Transposase n=1 Tax=Geomonas paludis TaxID=2740185 RepID=A0A6V8MZ22_9BACT|nr:transposase [Geomonas paludis]
MSEAVDKFGFNLHAFALMTNHYHLIVETPESNLSKIMHYLNSSYSTYTNIKRKRCGHLFQGRFKSIVVDTDTYLLELSRYVHLNPVRAHLVAKPSDYAHSSYRTYIGSEKATFVTTSTILGMLSSVPREARKKYGTFVDSVTEVEQASPLTNLYGGIILGRTNFIKDALSRIEVHRLEREETSYRKALSASELASDVLSAVGLMFQMSPDALKEKGQNEFKKKILYILKRRTSATNHEIGEIVGMSGVAVAKAYQRFVRDVITNSRLREEIEELEAKLSRVKG